MIENKESLKHAYLTYLDQTRQCRVWEVCECVHPCKTPSFHEFCVMERMRVLDNGPLESKLLHPTLLANKKIFSLLEDNRRLKRQVTELTELNEKILNQHEEIIEICKRTKVQVEVPVKKRLEVRIHPDADGVWSMTQLFCDEEI